MIADTHRKRILGILKGRFFGNFHFALAEARSTISIPQVLPKNEETDIVTALGRRIGDKRRRATQADGNSATARKFISTRS